MLRCHEELLGTEVADVGDPAASGRVAITLHGLLGEPPLLMLDNADYTPAEKSLKVAEYKVLKST